MRAVLLACLLLVACSSEPRPLPSGPPPEYEPPRDYDAGTDIDGLRSPEAAEDDGLGEAMPSSSAIPSAIPSAPQPQPPAPSPP